MYSQSMEIEKRLSGEDSPRFAGNQNNLAEVRRMQGRYAEARLLFESALITFEKVLSPEHSRIATVLNNLAELNRIQRRLNEQGFKTDGIDGRTGSDTIRAILAFQKKVGMEPADGYAGLELLARLRQGP